MLPELLTRAEAARLLRVSERTLDRWSIEGHLPRVLLGRAVRYRVDDIAAALLPNSEAQAANPGSAQTVDDGDQRAVYAE